jgi:hypothetical protein
MASTLIESFDQDTRIPFTPIGAGQRPVEIHGAFTAKAAEASSTGPDGDLASVIEAFHMRNIGSTRATS